MNVLRSLKSFWLFDPIDCSLPGSSVYGILQGRILEWIAMSSSRGSSQPRDQTQDAALQADSLPSESPGKFMGGEGYMEILYFLLSFFVNLQLL